MAWRGFACISGIDGIARWVLGLMVALGTVYSNRLEAVITTFTPFFTAF